MDTVMLDRAYELECDDAAEAMPGAYIRLGEHALTVGEALALWLWMIEDDTLDADDAYTGLMVPCVATAR